MKILHILDELRYSGAEVMLKVASPSFLALKFESHVLCTGEELGEYASTLQNAGYTIHHYPLRKFPTYFIELYKFIRKQEFEVVHIHPERAFFWHALIAKTAGVRTIVRTVHNVFLFNGYLRFKRTLQRWISSNVLGTEFVSVGPSVAEVERKLFHNNTRLIRNWIDQTEFRPPSDESERKELRIKYGLSPTDVILVSVGACTKQKNHEAIVSALAQIVTFYSNLTYLHVGEGPLLQEEMATAKSMGVFERVKLVPQTRFIRELLSSSDIFVMASTHEGLSISSIEAMSCGLPIVAYDVYGLRDVVENGRTGFLTDPTSDALAEALKRLVENEELRKEAGMAACSNVLRNFSMARSLEKLKALYEGQDFV
jgi:glycosyltransferase involved in cell wall biosynthesis